MNDNKIKSFFEWINFFIQDKNLPEKETFFPTLRLKEKFRKIW